MNGKQAKRLRKIAAELGRPAETGYAFAGSLRRQPPVTLPDGRVIPGAPIRRWLELTDCQRRAEKEAKKLYREQARDG